MACPQIKILESDTNTSLLWRVCLYTFYTRCYNTHIYCIAHWHWFAWVPTVNMDDSSNLSCVVLYFPQFSSSTSAPCARRRNVNKKPCECSSREYFQPNSHTPSYRHTVQFRSSRPTRNRSRPLTECEYISLSTILLLLQLLLLLLILQTQLVIILLYYYHY